MLKWVVLKMSNFSASLIIGNVFFAGNGSIQTSIYVFDIKYNNKFSFGGLFLRRFSVLPKNRGSRVTKF